MTLFQDARYAVRSLWHSKGFAAVAMLCLGLGIGVNTAIFSIIDGILLKPYPFEDPDRILVLGTVKPKDGQEDDLSFPDLRDWQAANRSFSSIGAIAFSSLTVADGAGEPDRYAGARASWNMFRLLGMTPLHGRDFVESDDRRDAPAVVIIGYSLWTTRYRSDPQVVGREILIDDKPHTVIGVMPQGFAFPENQRLWTALEPHVYANTRDARYLFTFGRLRPEVTEARALADLNTIAGRLAREYPATNEGWSARLRTLHEAFVPEEATLVLMLMMAGVTLVLFIACSNVANLLLARAARRRRELAVRVAIGAGRGRIIRQLLTESVVLALASVPLGAALAVAATRLLQAQVPREDLPDYIVWSVDGRSLAYTFAVAVSTALVFGLVPALQTTKRELLESLKDGGRSNTGGRAIVRNTLVVAQVSLALVALVGALLFVRSFRNLDTYEVGFDTASTLTLRFFMAGDQYQPKGAKLRRVEDILQRVEALPGVQHAFASNLIPIAGGGNGGNIEVQGRTNDQRDRPSIGYVGVSPDIHRTLGVRVVRGRDLTDADASQPNAVVNETLARRVWPAEDAIGRRFRLWNPAGSREWMSVVGVVADTQIFGLDPTDSRIPPVAFVPYAHEEAASTGLTIRVDGDAAAIVPAVRAAIRASDPGLPVYVVRTLDEVRRLEFWQFGLYGWIFGTIGAIGLLLASIGVYGMLAYSVSQRTQEIGLRVALGADRRHVLKLVMGQGLALGGTGVIVGLVLASVGTPLARSLLYKVSPFDPVSFAAVSTFLVAVALLASYVPARRATRVDPLVALRDE